MVTLALDIFIIYTYLKLLMSYDNRLIIAEITYRGKRMEKA